MDAKLPLTVFGTIRLAVFIAALIIVGSGCAAPGDPGSASVAAALPLEVPLVPYLGRLVTVEAQAGGRPLKLIFDTGGGETLIAPQVAAALGCTPSGRGIGYRASAEQIEFRYCPDVTLTIAGKEFPHERIAVWDVRSVLPDDVPPVDGVLSLATFRSQPFTMQLADRRLMLETAASLTERVLAMSPLRTRIATGPDGGELTVFVLATAPARGWFLIDSGNLDVVRLGPHYPAAGEADADGVWESRLTLEGAGPVRARFRTAQIIYDGLLSEEFLRQWTLTFDLAGNQVWARPAGSD
jgi:hypothetical protein